MLVSGRTMANLASVFSQLELFDRVVAENGAILHAPHARQTRLLAEPPPPALIESLRERGVKPLDIGQVIVATHAEHEREVRQAIAKARAALDVILNKDALMILPRGVDKATGLTAALAELNLPPGETVAVGDAENDAVLLAVCGQGVAVANALPALKAAADWVTQGKAGQGVIELINRLLDNAASTGG